MYFITLKQGFGSPFFCGSGPGKNMRIRADPDPKTCLEVANTNVFQEEEKQATIQFTAENGQSMFQPFEVCNFLMVELQLVVVTENLGEVDFLVII